MLPIRRRPAGHILEQPNRFDVSVVTQVEPVPVVGRNRNEVAAGHLNGELLPAFAFKPKDTPA
jgi:hypothetical protein